MKIIFDHNLSPLLARSLQELFRGEHEVVALRDKFKPNITDIELIRALSEEGTWVFISADRRINRNKAERETFRNSRLIGFFFSRSLYKARVTKQAERLLALWEPMEKIVSALEGGALFELPMRSTRIRQLKN